MARTAWLAFGAAIVASTFVGSSRAAPAPVPGEKWEYAEISTSLTATRGPGRFDDPRARPQPGQPDQPRRVVRQTMIRFATAEGEVEAASWQELATKLKAPEPKSGGTSAASQRLRVLNYLGSQGWEVVSGGGGGAWSTSSSSLLLKRKARR